MLAGNSRFSCWTENFKTIYCFNYYNILSIIFSIIMNFIALKVRATNSMGKDGFIRDLKFKHNVSFLCLTDRNQTT